MPLAHLQWVKYGIDLHLLFLSGISEVYLCFCPACIYYWIFSCILWSTRLFAPLFWPILSQPCSHPSSPNFYFFVAAFFSKSVIKNIKLRAQPETCTCKPSLFMSFTETHFSYNAGKPSSHAAQVWNETRLDYWQLANREAKDYRNAIYSMWSRGMKYYNLLALASETSTELRKPIGILLI